MNHFQMVMFSTIFIEGPMKLKLTRQGLAKLLNAIDPQPKEYRVTPALVFIRVVVSMGLKPSPSSN